MLTCNSRRMLPQPQRWACTGSVVVLTVVGALGSPLAAQTKKLYPSMVDDQIDAAIQRCLEFLKRSQNRDGSCRGLGG